jgi:hypothetical protein
MEFIIRFFKYYKKLIKDSNCIRRSIKFIIFLKKIVALGLFEIVVVVQSAFHLKIHQNNFFIVLKIIFKISTSKK